MAALIKGYTETQGIACPNSRENGTNMSAKAVMLEDKIGSLEAGKKPNIQLIDISCPIITHRSFIFGIYSAVLTL